MSLHTPDLDGTSFKIMHGFDHHENSMGRRSKPMPLLPNHDAQMEPAKAENSNKTLKYGEYLEMEDRGLSRRMTKDKLHGEMRAMNEDGNSSRVMVHPTNATGVAKRDQDEFPRQQ